MTGPRRVFSVAQLIHKWMSSVVCQMTLLLGSDAEAARFSIGRGPSKCGRRRSTCDRSMRGQAARVLISCATRLLLQCRPADPAGAASAHQGSGRDAADERSRRALERLPEHSYKCDGSRCSRRRLPLAPVWHLRAEQRAYACAQAWRDRGPPGCCARRREVRGSGSGSTPPRGRTVAGGSGATIAAAAAAAATAGAAPRASFCVTCDIAPDSERPVRHPRISSERSTRRSLYYCGNL